VPVSAADIQQCVALLLEARATGKPAQVGAIRLADAADAYRVQDAVAQRLGGIDGWKVGAKHPGATPTCAPLLTGTIVRAMQHAPTISVEGAAGVEVEVAYVLGRDFAPGENFTDEDILAGVAGAHVAVELCRSRLGDHTAADPLWMLADNQVNEKVIIGPAILDWRGLDPASASAHLIVDGMEKARTVGGHPTKATLTLLIWLVRYGVRERGGLKRGHVVMTGSWTGMQRIVPPANIEAAIEPGGKMRFRLVHP
jgi:2-keto-4-pentenoate hydratase